MDFKGELAFALVLNVALKFLTFALSTALTRQLAPHENGVNFSCQLYFNTVLFLARDCVRSVNARQNLRERAGDGKIVLRVMNCSIASLPLGIFVMAVLEVLPLCGVSLLPSLTALSHVKEDSAAMSLGLANNNDSSSMGIPELLLALSVVVSLTIEPCITLVYSFDYAKIIVTSEFWALLARLIVCLMFLKFRGGLGGDMYTARMCFAIGSLAYAVVTVVYFLWLWNNDKSCGGGGGGGNNDKDDDLLQKAKRGAMTARWGVAAVPSSSSSSSSCSSDVILPPSLWLRAYFPWSFLSLRSVCDAVMSEGLLLRQFFSDSCLRLVLAEGEHFALATFASAAVMGQYDVVANLGSLVARLLFRVWESACFVKWSRDAAAGRPEEAAALLLAMLRVATYFGAAGLLVVPPLAESFLLRLFSSRWASPAVVRALQFYSLLLPLLAVYGLLDAFVRATSSAALLRLSQTMTMVQAAVYAAACYLVLRLQWVDDPTTGLILVNIISMALRCGSSLCLILMGHVLTTPREVDGGAGHGRLRLRDFIRTVVNTRVMLSWAALFTCTRWGPWGQVSALTAAPLFAWAIVVWDHEIRQVALSILRR